MSQDVWRNAHRQRGAQGVCPTIGQRVVGGLVRKLRNSVARLQCDDLADWLRPQEDRRQAIVCIQRRRSSHSRPVLLVVLLHGDGQHWQAVASCADDLCACCDGGPSTNAKRDVARLGGTGQRVFEQKQRLRAQLINQQVQATKAKRCIVCAQGLPWAQAVAALVSVRDDVKGAHRVSVLCLLGGLGRWCRLLCWSHVGGLIALPCQGDVFRLVVCHGKANGWCGQLHIQWVVQGSLLKCGPAETGPLGCWISSCDGRRSSARSQRHPTGCRSGSRTCCS